ncbi:MAG TPA: hypothetical protein VE134_07865, partial [Methanomicrobiales archaeon]|nr:hypothetical protein [Methanomicrobiales archaeon]
MEIALILGLRIKGEEGIPYGRTIATGRVREGCPLPPASQFISCQVLLSDGRPLLGVIGDRIIPVILQPK